jgi:hypothetical protein
MSAELIRAAQTEPRDYAIMALDGMTWPKAEELMYTLNPYIGMVKGHAIGIRTGFDHAVNTAGHYGMRFIGI